MISAKDTSLVAQILGAVILIAGLALKGLGILRLDIHELLLGAFGVMGIFSPVYLSLILDKVKGRER